MAEYLAPGVYVEEFDSGIKAMEGVGTSTGGFLGMTEKGPTVGKPVLLTSFADYQRKFGGYLSERVYGSTRYLPYAIEQFFVNGGSSCYVMRVAPPTGAKSAEGKVDFLTVTAANEGSWGNAIQFVLRKNTRDRSEIKKEQGLDKLSGNSNIMVGDLIDIKSKYQIGKVKNIKTDSIQLEWTLTDEKNISVLEFDVTIYDDKTTESHKNISFNPKGSNFIQTKIDSKLVDIIFHEDKITEGAIEKVLAKADGKDLIHITLKGGKNEEVVNGGGVFAEGGLDFLTIKAKKEGADGNNIHVTFNKIKKENLNITEKLEYTYELKKNRGYAIGDLICIEPITIKEGECKFGRVNSVTDDDYSFLLQQGNNCSMSVMELDVLIDAGAASEYYEKVSLNPNASNYIVNKLAKSEIVTVSVDTKKILQGTFEALFKKVDDTEIIIINMEDGSDGNAASYQNIIGLIDQYKGVGTPGKRTGLQAFMEVNDVNIMAIPGITEPALQLELVTHCENLMDRFAVLDIPLDVKTIDELSQHRNNFDSNYAAIYHPWIQCYDSTTKKAEYFPPSGAVVGIYARTDIARGVHKAPANEIVKNCTGLSVNYNEAEQGKLNPKGINLIRMLSGQGIRVWGARTCSSDGNWKYVNVRRLFIFIEESIKKNTNWAVFEPNDEILWSRVEGTIKVFLTTLWRNGALMGSSPDAAFYVNVGNTTMTADDILNGRLICEIGVAPVRPAEFVIFRITQKMQDA